MIRAVELEAQETLLFYLDNAASFWLALVTAHTSRSRARLRAFAEQSCKKQGIAFHFHRPKPEELFELAVTLTVEPPPGMHWICLDHWLGLDVPEDTWEKATMKFLMAMNERREAYIRRLKGSIVLEGKTLLKTQMRDLAPDLFTICAFVAEPAGPELVHLREKPVVAPLLPRFPTEFVGRSRELEEVAALLHSETQRPVVALSGRSGVGKSYLSVEYAKRRSADYPDGIFYLKSASFPPSDLLAVGERLGEPYAEGEPMVDYYHRVLDSLIFKHALLIYDGVEEVGDGLQKWLPPEDAECHALLTTTLNADSFPSDFGICELGALEDADARALVAQVLRVPEAIERWTEPLVARAGGVTLELCALAKEVERAVVAGREVIVAGPPTAEMESSLLGPWLGLSDDARFILKAASLFDPWALPQEELWGLLEGEGWEKRRFERAVDAACDRMLLVKDDGVLRMHPLVLAFVRGRGEPGLSDALKLRHLKRFIDVLQVCGLRPQDEATHRRIKAYPEDPAVWEAMGGEVTELVVKHSDKVGTLLFDSGRFEGARLWYTRALTATHAGVQEYVDNAAKRSGLLSQLGRCYYEENKIIQAIEYLDEAMQEANRSELWGDTDYQRFGIVLHNMGTCYWKQQDFTHARTYFEEATVAKQKGDSKHRIDHDSLGTSLHFLGMCYLEENEPDKAITFLDHAVGETKKGNLDQRVDHEKLASSLSMLGQAHSMKGQYEQARRWIKKAIKEHKKGDIRARIHYQNLGNSLRVLGEILLAEGDSYQARAYLEQAIDAYKKGDIFGRIDSESLANAQRLLASVLQKLHPSPLLKP